MSKKNDPSYNPSDEEYLSWQKSLMACEFSYEYDSETFKFNNNGKENTQEDTKQIEAIKQKWKTTFGEEITITPFYGPNVYFDDNNPNNDVRGVIISTPDSIFVASKGTNSLDDMLSDANCVFDSDKEVLDGANIHQGFLKIFQGIDKNEFIKKMTTATDIKKNDGQKKIYILLAIV
jgi:hypothetical protein